MAVRSIKLKMILPRGESGERVRKSLWLTHSVVNNAVAEIERVLLLCRGRSYCTEDGVVSEEAVAEAAIGMARDLQAANGKPRAASDEDVLTELRRLYEAIVPSILLDKEGKPLPGSAQAAGGFASPLMDARSEGKQQVFEEIVEPLPEWVGAWESGNSDAEALSKLWRESAVGQRLSKPQHRPSTWVMRVRAGQPWQESFIEDQKKKRKEVEGVPLLIRHLKQDLGLLPFLKPPIASRFGDRGCGLTPWDRLALRLAVAHLLSWESWNHRAADEHRQVCELLQWQQSALTPVLPLVAELRRYETERHKELKRIALADDGRPFRIGLRTIRAWDRVRERWLGAAGTTRTSRMEMLAELQTKLPGRFGDPDLFRWLAVEGREPLWQDHDLLPDLARCNALERLLDRKKSCALYTPPDPIHHPRWSGYEAPGGSNLRNYAVHLDDGKVNLAVPLLVAGAEGLAEARFQIQLAPSGQLDAPRWNDQQGKSRRLLFRSAHQEYSADLGGGEVFFSRRHLENRRPEELEAGSVGPVWLKLVLEVDSQAPAEWLDRRGRIVTPPIVNHFQTGLARKSEHVDSLAPGLRVLSVDLGLRTFGSCSVFELVQGRPATGMAFRADTARDLWARHERSFLLSLPGETPDRDALAARKAAYDDLRALRRDSDRLKGILRLSVKESPDERQAGLEELLAAIQEELSQRGSTAFEPAAIARLKELVDCPSPHWEVETKKLHQEMEKILGVRLGRWRKDTRRRTSDGSDRKQRRGYNAGKSAWAVNYLEAVRKLLIGWTLRGRSYGQINRLDREKRGTFAATLLEHIAGLKEDRVKTGSDLIVQAARGFVPAEGKGWQRRYQPCRLILFEDLARYRFRTDRPRRENSQLMRWCHREIIAQTNMQAEIYGIVVSTTGAGFSSRFHARTGAPACRAHLLTSEDLASEGVQRQLQTLAEQSGIAAQRLQPGVRVPWEGGEELVTLTDDGGTVVAHADLNAAQNLQRRFWTRHADAYRLSAVGVKQGGRDYWYCDSDGVRLRGALAALVGGEGYVRLTPAEDGEGFVIASVSKSHWKKAIGGEGSASDEEGLNELALELAEALDAEDFERGRQKQVFFRDPSGNVLRGDRWYEGKEFWGRVRQRIARALGLKAGED